MLRQTRLRRNALPLADVLGGEEVVRGVLGEHDLQCRVHRIVAQRLGLHAVLAVLLHQVLAPCLHTHHYEAGSSSGA